MKQFRVVNEETVELLDGPFAGILYQYGGVQLEPDHVLDQLSLAFTYEILSGPRPSDEAAFHQYIGDILVDLIHESIKTGSTVYRSAPSGDLNAPRDQDNRVSDLV